MMNANKSKYIEYKKDYENLKNNHTVDRFTLSKIVQNAYDEAIKKFADMYIIIDSDPYKIFRLHQFGEDKRYIANRYVRTDKDKPLECDTKKFIVNNPDSAYEFINEKKRIFIDPMINELPHNDSTGTTRWESYNWTLYRDDNKFHIAFGRMDDSFKAELGVKHTMLGQGHDFYAGGELRIVKDENNPDSIIVQVNLDSSSFGPGFANIFKHLCEKYLNCSNTIHNVMDNKFPEITDIDTSTKTQLSKKLSSICPFGLKEEKFTIICNDFNEKYNDLMDFKITGKIQNQKKSHFDEPPENPKYRELQRILNHITTIIKDVIKQIFVQLNNDSVHYRIQIVGDNEWYPVGLNGKRGLHWYYYNDSCPSDQYILEANEWARSHGQETGFIVRDESIGEK